MDCVNSKGLTVALFLASAVNFPLHFLGRKIFIYVPIITADNLDTDARGALLHEENSKLDFKEEYFLIIKTSRFSYKNVYEVI